MACVCFFYSPVVDSYSREGVVPASRGSRWVRPELGPSTVPRAAARLPKLPPGLLAEVPPRSASFPGAVRSFSAVLYPPVQLLVWWERGGRWGPRATLGWWRVETESNAGVKTRRDGVGGDWRGAGGARGTRGRPPAGAAVCGRGRGEAYGGTAPPPAALFFPVARTRGPTGCGWSVGSLSYEGGRGLACGAHL